MSQLAKDNDVISQKFNEDLMKLVRSGSRTSGDGKRRLSFNDSSFYDASESHNPSKSPRIASDRHKVVTLRGEISILQHRLEQESIAKRRSNTFHEEEINSLSAQRRKIESESEEYKSKLKNCRSTMNEIQSRLDECHRQLTDAQNDADDKLFKLAKANIQRENELMEKIDKVEVELGQAKSDLLKEKMKSSECEEDIIGLKRQLDTKSREIEEYKSYIMEKENAINEMSSLQQKIQSLEDEIARNKDTELMVKAMKSKLDKFPRLEKENVQLVEENQKLREREANIYLLQDENRTLRRKVDLITQTQADLAAAETEMEKLRNQLRAWEQCGSDSDGRDSSIDLRCSVFRSPDELHRHLRELQRDNLHLSECRGLLQSSIADLEMRLNDQKREMTKLSRSQKENEDRSQTLEAEIKRVNQRFKLVSQERDFAKRLIDEYEQDTTSSFGQDEKARIACMDSLLKTYKAQITEQDQTIQRLRRIDVSKSQYLSSEKTNVAEQKASDSLISQSCEKLIVDLRQRVAELEEKLAKVTREKEEVTQEKEILEMRIEKRNLQGDYDPTTTKVLHLELNPASESTRKRAEEVERLKKENERLQKLVQVLEETKTSVKSGETGEELSGLAEKRTEGVNSQKEVEELKLKLQSESRKAERLIEVFKERSQQMREACFHLLGHKLDIKPSGEVKLTSSLADSPDEFLLFRAEEEPAKESDSASTSGGRRWMLMETEYSLKLRKDIEHYIKTYNSIPALVCSVFLENFGRQTMLE